MSRKFLLDTLPMTDRAFAIEPVRTRADLAAVRQLFEAYAASLDVDLGYQSFADELATLPGNYAPPAGELLLARSSDGSAIGCVALRPLATEGCCEMKRLYVVPQARGAALGRALIGAICETARRIGYREIRLDTLPSMRAAQALYETEGFNPIAPYYDTPIAGTRFFAKSL